MAQLTIRAEDEIVERIKDSARAAGQSVNRFIVETLNAATNSDYAGSAADRTRERLRRAGLLDESDSPPAGLTRPDPRKLAAAKRRAGQGTSLSDLVIADRDRE